ncbi:MAG TPA: pyridoxal phosphate-dependent aminotransferase, partial [Candidatus Angelobacter sp.]
IEQLEINGPSIYGYEPLLRAIAERYRVPQSCVVSAIGASMANYLAVAAATETGDEILIEQPAYDPLLGIARYLGLKIRRFQRPAELNFAIDLEDLKRNLTPRTRLIVITNMHNPSGVLCPDETLNQVAALAREAGALVLVDEVYREMLFQSWPRTAFDIDRERFLVASSLTKAYGLSGVRCGWVLAPPELAERMWHINDLHGSTFTHPGELLSVIALAKLPQIAERMKALLDENRKVLRQFLSSHPQLDYQWPEYGTIVFPRLHHGQAETFCQRLRQEFDTSVAPGRFFECSDRFRIGVGGATEEVRAALDQLGRALKELPELP